MPEMETALQWIEMCMYTILTHQYGITKSYLLYQQSTESDQICLQTIWFWDHCNNYAFLSQHISVICFSVCCSLNYIRRCIYISSFTLVVRKSLYVSLVRSKMTYCSQLWRPLLRKDITVLENVQQQATKFILDYKNRLILCNHLPLMYYLILQDIHFIIKCLQKSAW